MWYVFVPLMSTMIILMTLMYVHTYQCYPIYVLASCTHLHSNFHSHTVFIPIHHMSLPLKLWPALPSPRLLNPNLIMYAHCPLRVSVSCCHIVDAFQDHVSYKRKSEPSSAIVSGVFTSVHLLPIIAHQRGINTQPFTNFLDSFLSFARSLATYTLMPLLPKACFTSSIHTYISFSLARRPFTISFITLFNNLSPPILSMFLNHHRTHESNQSAK